jgi:dihydroorotase
MHILIKSAKILDKSSAFHGKTADILIEDGIIKQIGENLKSNKAEIIEKENLHVSIGWFDMRVNFRDPGFEYKEDIFSGIKAAASGGFTGVLVMPSTLPPIHSKAEVEYIRNKSKGAVVDVFPAGTVSHRLEGKDLSEMYDMHLSGAIAFTDDKQAVSDPGLLQKALLYVKGFNGLIISFPEDKKIASDGKINEGVISTSTGLKGTPALAEELMIARDIYLTEYTDSRLHIATVSSAKSVELIRQAKKKGLQITAEVTAHHLALDESELLDFDSNFKVKPPLRTSEDIKALVEGLADGTIDVICSDHSPEDIEMKQREFDHAAFGTIGLESAFGAANAAVSASIDVEDLIEKISINPRKVLGLKIPAIKEGEKANLTLFTPNEEWTFDQQHIKSKSNNTPFKGKKLRGRAVAVINNGLMEWC